MALDPAVLAAPTVLRPPSGGRVARDLVYRIDGARSLQLDVYRPASVDEPRPVVFLVNGDADDQQIATAKDWGVYRSYGEHLAGSGLVGVPFNHRSTQQGAQTDEAKQDVNAAISFAREHAGELGLDPDRVGLWVFSAGGPFGLAPLLQRRPSWLRCAAGFYTIWDLEPFRANLRPPVDQRIRRYSCVTALDGEALDLPPLLVARAGRDSPGILAGTDTFIRRARESGADVTVLEHPTGQHGFDIRDDDARSREIISKTLAFFVRHLRGL
jgi:acetyl esterase/lipase